MAEEPKTVQLEQSLAELIAAKRNDRIASYTQKMAGELDALKRGVYDYINENLIIGASATPVPVTYHVRAWKSYEEETREKFVEYMTESGWKGQFVESTGYMVFSISI